MSRARSDVLALVAIFIALGGTTYAASQVGSGDIERNAVKSRHIGSGQVKTSDIGDGQIGAVDLADGAVNSAKVANGSVQGEDLTPGEPFRDVGAAGQPAFGTGGDGDCLWENNPATEEVGFYKDALGEVHLSGGLAVATDAAGGDGACDATTNAEAVEDLRVFTLPPGYRPDRATVLPATGNISATTAPPGILIGADEDTDLGAGATLPAGAVVGLGHTAGTLSLSGSFRAAG